MISFALSLFGYMRVPKEAVQLIVAVRSKWEKNPTDKDIGSGLVALEALLRSAQK